MFMSTVTHVLFVVVVFFTLEQNEREKGQKRILSAFRQSVYIHSRVAKSVLFFLLIDTRDCSLIIRYVV
jgi:hypothetical protein